jgi:hypothetical protein
LCAIPAFGQTSAPEADRTEKRAKKIVQLDLENGIDRYFYYTRYSIGGTIKSRDGIFKTFFPISELKFPLNVFTIHGNLNLTLLDRLTIQFSVIKNIGNRAGKMKDSDWVLPGFLSIYSESDARVNAVFTDADLIVRLFTVSIFSLKFGGGFMHQYIYFLCSNAEQKDLIPGDTPYLKISGKSLTYEVRYYIPTIQVVPVFTILNRFEIILAIRFSPHLWARDIDDHLLRAKKSKGNSTGTAFLPGIRLRYLFATGIYITARLDCLFLDTKGKQTQSYYLPVQEANNIPGWSARLDTRLRSQQLSVSLGAGYSFDI